MSLKEKLNETRERYVEMKAKLDDSIETAKISAMLTQDEIAEKTREAQGNAEAAKENLRRMGERSQSRLNSELIKIQMSVDAARQAIADKKEAREQVKAEARIADLIEYADHCQALALELALESKLAILEATAEIAEYAEKYGTEA